MAQQGEWTGTLEDLVRDPKNARRRTERSSYMIRKSLEKFGPLRSLVGHRTEDGKVVIDAGNGTYEEAGQLGIEKVRFVPRKADELVVVVAEDLSPEQLAEYAVADNRTSDLSDWDAEQLVETHEEIGLGDWFTGEEIKAWDGEDEDLPEEGDADTQEAPENWAVMIECSTEQEQSELLEEFMERGLQCQALIS